METTQIAKKYGVPMPETCKELNWQGETLFYWYFNHEWLIMSFADLEMSDGYFDSFERYPAPQMHEIASVLVLEHKEEYLFTLNYEKEVGVCRDNYAEAYAKMYLELKANNLI